MFRGGSANHHCEMRWVGYGFSEGRHLFNRSLKDKNMLEHGREG